jgi:hypothetical protein
MYAISLVNNPRLFQAAGDLGQIIAGDGSTLLANLKGRLGTTLTGDRD